MQHDAGRAIGFRFLCLQPPNHDSVHLAPCGLVQFHNDYSHLLRGIIMRIAIMMLMIMAIAGVAIAQNLGNSREFPEKNTPTVTYVPPAEPKQGGDTVFDATVIQGLPYSDTGNTCGYTNDYDEVCPYTGSTSPDVVYSFTPGSDRLIGVDLCGSQYDTKTYIYDSGLNLVACNDDFYFDEVCGVYVSRIENAPLMAGETYFIVIDGYGGDCGNYDLTVGGDCCPPPCWVTCDSDDALAEGEPPLGPGYIDAWNGGCNSDPSVFQDINFGTVDGLATLCGVSGWYDDNFRDTDWFTAEFGESGMITVTLESQYPCNLFELGPQDCGSVGVLQSMEADCDAPVTMTVFGDPGSVTWLWVGPTVYVSPDGTTEFPYILTIEGHDVFVVPTEELSWGGVKALYR